MSKPGFYLYYGDWVKATRMLTLEAQGAWVGIIAHLNENGIGGVEWSLETFARFWSTELHNAMNIIRQLKEFETAEVEWSAVSPDGEVINNLSTTKLDEIMAESANKDPNKRLTNTLTKPYQILTKLSCRRITRAIEKREHISRVRSEAGKIGMKNRYQKAHSSLSSSLNLNSNKNTSKKKYSLSESAVELAKLLAELIRKNNPNVTEVKDAQLDAWAKEADRMERIDHHQFTEIRLVLEWSQQDGFWRRNILSMSKLREKWNILSGRMMDQAEREGGCQTYADRVRERTMQILKGGKQ